MKEAFNSLREQDPLKKAIKKAVRDLSANAFSGIQIPKRLLPKDYIERYGIKNLWKYDLIKGWRLIYTINLEKDVELITAILEWFDHKEYGRRFKHLFHSAFQD